jgi:site-specific DNA-methyltransferase (cytosine-N4-specific)
MKYRFYWAEYKLFLYEKELGLREVKKLYPNDIELTEHQKYIEVISSDKVIDNEYLERLTYFSRIEIENKTVYPLITKLESNKKTNRQHTRYSAHGLHEYKGKFNPQIVHSLLNLFKIDEESLVLDPFCGSGTTLLESRIMNIHSIGIDANPLAVFIANAKQKAAISNPIQLKEQWNQITEEYNHKVLDYNLKDDIRSQYLKEWFPEKYLVTIEVLKDVIDSKFNENRDVFLTVISNNLRDYSNQEPADLRIRKRRTPFPEINLMDKITSDLDKLIENVSFSQKYLSIKNDKNEAFLANNKTSNSLNDYIEINSIDLGITSPPYATALPYIDTQRLSLVWLGFTESKDILNLERELTGTRELRKAEIIELNSLLLNNHNNLPDEIAQYCTGLYNSLCESDGFRRQAVPALLYHYFSDMYLMFKNIYPYFKKDGIFSLVVGTNHTTLGGIRFDIDTPYFLQEVACLAGWKKEDSIKLQTYKRYGIHHKNAVGGETLIILRK